MKLIILYREQSDHARSVYEFEEMLKRKYPNKTPELIDIETKEGANIATLHQVVQYPAVLIVAITGQVVSQWQGLPMPLIDEVASYDLEVVK